MEIRNISNIYTALPQCGAFLKDISDESVRHVFLGGLLASSAPVFFSAVAERLNSKLKTQNSCSGKRLFEPSAKLKTLTAVFILQDNDEAGYFYHDLTQILGTDNVLFFPSSYRRAVKYGQRDAANEILRTETLSRLAALTSVDTQKASTGKGAGKNADCAAEALYVVTCPEALSELVVSKRRLDERTINIAVGDIIDFADLGRKMREFGFKEVDYVYEPGQFAMRGSIIDVYSYSSELPFRIDFFGDEVDTIRTFEVADQLSKDAKQQVRIVPELAQLTEEKQPFTSLLPDDALLVMKDRLYLCSTIEQIYNDGFSQQAMTERLEGATEVEQQQIMRDMRKENNLVAPTRFREEICRFRLVEFGAKPSGTPQVSIEFHISPQPLFHKNFSLLTQTLDDYLLQGYQLYILADSEKQTQRLRDIFDSEELQQMRRNSQHLNTSTPQHHNTPAQYPTFRNLIHNYNETHRWARFGNDLLLGVKADYNTTFEQQQFLPERLCADFERAHIISADGTKRNLVSSSFWLFEPTTKQQSIQQTSMSILDVFSPLVTFSILSILTLIIAIVEYRRKRIIWVFDTSLMLTTGACGLLLFAMIFSQHPTVSLNLQILLLNPINIFMLYSVTKAARQNRIHWWTKAWSALILLLLAGSFLQSYAEGITIVALSLLLRNISNIYTFKNTGSKQPEA